MTASDVLPPTTVQDLPVVDLDTNGDVVPVRSYSPTKWDIWILGITIGLGGQYFSWNSGLHAAGLYTYMIDYVVAGTAYMMLCCCTSEISGALPFAGGAYGLSRCTLGYFVGFLVGCAEACEYIAYVSTSVMSLANMLSECIPQLKGWEPLIWLLVYCHACYVHYRGDWFFWRWNRIIGLTSFLIVLLYIFGSIPHVDFSHNADTDPALRFVGGIEGFIKSLPVACWFFVGVEALSLASDDVQNPQREIPFAQLSCITMLSCLGVIVFFVTVSLPPQGLNQVSKLLAPLDNGFHNMFNISLEMSTLFSIPAMYATTFGFMWGYGKLISAMATSKLLPPVLARKSEKYDTPINAVVCGTVLSYFFSLTVFFVPTIEAYLYNVCIAAAFLGYASQCIGYISIKWYYPALKDSVFESPFGVPGAVYSLLVWVLGLVSVACFQDRNGIEFLGFVGLNLLLTAFYVVYAKHHQSFSEQESKVFLMAHVMKLSRRNKAKHHLVAKNPPRKRHRHLNKKHTPVVHAEPIVGEIVVPAQTSLGTRMGHLMSRDKSEPLALPVAKWLPESSPFYRYFSNSTIVETEYNLKVAAAKRAVSIPCAIETSVKEMCTAPVPSWAELPSQQAGNCSTGPVTPRLQSPRKRMIAYALESSEWEVSGDDEEQDHHGDRPATQTAARSLGPHDVRAEKKMGRSQSF